jgi:hypothetical protein
LVTVEKARLALHERAFSFMEQNIYISRKREDPFARIPHEILSDTRLSWKAKGVICYLLGKPYTWKVRRADLINQSTDGDCSVRAALKELREVGYVNLECIKGENGKVQEWRWIVSDTCNPPALKNQKSSPSKPDVGFPHVGNPPLSKKECSKKESKETKETSAAPDGLSFEPVWKPSKKSKEQQLGDLPAPKGHQFPSQEEFDAFLLFECSELLGAHRPDLYRDLCRHKWHHWRAKANHWVPIYDWKKYVSSLGEKMDNNFA